MPASGTRRTNQAHNLNPELKRKIKVNGGLPFVNAGVFGPKMSGKTTLAIELTNQMWKRLGRKALVVDPYKHENEWPESAWVTKNEAHFWQIVYKAKGYLIVVDEATEMINREKDLVPVFTALSHREHQLLVMGHGSTNLLPIMRRSLDRIYLFRQDEDDAKTWSKVFTYKPLREAENLKQSHFIDHKLYSDCHQVLTLKI